MFYDHFSACSLLAKLGRVTHSRGGDTSHMAQVVSVVYTFVRWSHKSYDDQPSYISLLILFAHIISASFVKMADGMV